MDLDPNAVGPRSPLTGTPARRSGSVRRTSTIDTVRTPGSPLIRTVEARARDLSTWPDGRTTEEEAVMLARVDAGTYELVELGAEPLDPRLSGLLGATVGPGFRRRLSSILTTPADRTSLTFLLLDDLPGAQLVAGYETVRGQGPGDRPDLDVVAALGSRIDFCAGWASDGALLRGIRDTAQVPAPVGPPAPSLDSVDDPDSWHETAPLPPRGMRRRRRLDVQLAEGEIHPFEAHFRDSHMSDRGEETILHEYLVTGRVDARRRALVAVEVEARVLPYVECPNALGSAERVVGWSLDELRRAVHRELTGVSSCTHLNDTLRSLCDLDALLDRMDAMPSGRSGPED